MVKYIGRDECVDENCILVPKNFFDVGFKLLDYDFSDIKKIDHNMEFNDSNIEGKCVHFEKFTPYKAGQAPKDFLGFKYEAPNKPPRYFLIIVKPYDDDKGDEIINYMYIQHLLFNKDNIPKLVSYSIYHDENKFDDQRMVQYIVEDLTKLGYTALEDYYFNLFENTCEAKLKQLNKAFINCNVSQEYREFNRWEDFINELITRKNIQNKHIIDKLQKKIVHFQKKLDSGVTTWTDKYENEFDVEDLIRMQNDNLEEYYHENKMITQMEPIFKNFYIPVKGIIYWNLDYMFRGYEQILENFFLGLFDFHIHFIIHNDLHANNIFIHPKTLQIKFIDFDHASVGSLFKFTESHAKFLIKTRDNWNTSSIQDKRRFLELFYSEEKHLSNYFTLIPECINPYFFLNGLTYGAHGLNLKEIIMDYYDANKSDKKFKQNFNDFVKMIKTIIGEIFPYIKEYFIDKYTTTVLKHYSTLPSPSYRRRTEPEPEPEPEP